MAKDYVDEGRQWQQKIWQKQVSDATEQKNFLDSIANILINGANQIFFLGALLVSIPIVIILSNLFDGVIVVSFSLFLSFSTGIFAIRLSDVWEDVS